MSLVSKYKFVIKRSLCSFLLLDIGDIEVCNLIFQETRKFQYVFLTPLCLENIKEEMEDVNVVYFKKNEG